MRNKSGVALSGMLLGCLSGLVLSSALRADAPEQQPKNDAPADAAAHRQAMIQELEAIDRRLSEILAELQEEDAGSGS